jgi:hypothetical protein
MHQALVAAEAAPADFDEAAAWLERQFRAGEAQPAYNLIEAWMNDRAAAKPAVRTKRPVKAGGKPRSKKAGKP